MNDPVWVHLCRFSTEFRSMANAASRILFRYGSVALAAAFLFLGSAAGVRVGLHEERESWLIGRIAARQDLNHVTNMDVTLDPSRMGKITSFFLRISRKGGGRAAADRNERSILEELAQLKSEIRASTGDSLVLVGFALAYLLGASALARRIGGLHARIYSLLAVSLVFFGIGITCPVVTAVVKGQHKLIGGFIIETASKGIVSTVVSLFRSGNGIIGFLLAAFSIGIPVFKAVAVLAVSSGGSRRRMARMGRLLESIGKWSLTDVLVAAVLLGCFSLNAIRQSDGGVFAVPRLAFGFFVLYTVLAARTSYLLRRLGKAGIPSVKAPGRRLFGRAATLSAVLIAGAASGWFVRIDVPYRGDAGVAAIMRLVRADTGLSGAGGP
ncbi:MAG: paraquat-inducible protein A [Opitutaceae bacterium]